MEKNYGYSNYINVIHIITFISREKIGDLSAEETTRLEITIVTRSKAEEGGRGKSDLFNIGVQVHPLNLFFIGK